LETERDQKNQIVEHLLSKVECELPVNMVREEARRILSETVSSIKIAAWPTTCLKRMKKRLWKRLRKRARPAERQFILLRIAERRTSM